MPKHHKVPGMAGRSNKRPVCSVDPTHLVQRDYDGRWLCRDCAEDYIRNFMKDAVEKAHLSEGGVELPSGVKDERVETKVDIAQFMPNRAQRRRFRGN